MADDTPRYKASLTKTPWGPIAKNVGTVGAGFLLGSLASGLMANVIARTPEARDTWSRLSPKTKRRLAVGLGGAAGALVPLAAMGTHAATQAALYKDLEDIKRRRREEEREGDKVASVMLTYRLALEGIE